MMLAIFSLPGLAIGDTFPEEAVSAVKVVNGFSLNGISLLEINCLEASGKNVCFSGAGLLSVIAVTSSVREMYFQKTARFVKRMINFNPFGKMAALNSEKELAGGKLFISSIMPNTFLFMALSSMYTCLF